MHNSLEQALIKKAEARIKFKIKQLETKSIEDIGQRQVTSLLQEDDLYNAAKSIAEHPHPFVAIITGFYIPHANPPGPETDGLIGAAHLAKGLQNGRIPVRLITDEKCAEALRTACRTAGINNVEEICNEIKIDDIERENSIEELTILKRHWKNNGVTHIISIERVGPAEDGRCYNMRGDDITSYTAPLHILFDQNLFTTIGIGDGGNEIGCGKIPQYKLNNTQKEIACVVPSTYLIMTGVSNWGAVALLGSIALLRPDLEDLLNNLTLKIDFLILNTLIENQLAVDGINTERNLSVDNLLWWDVHARVFLYMLDVLEST